MDIDAQFEEIKGLIRAKRFAEARQLLTSMTHPKAVRWLEHLDEIDSHPLSNSAPVIEPPIVQPDETKEKVKMPRGHPGIHLRLGLSLLT